MRQQPDLRGAAILTPDGRWIAGDGLRRADLPATVLQDLVGARAARVLGDGETVRAVAPIRYARQVVGLAVTSGSSGAAETVRDASLVLAPLCGPAARAHLSEIERREAGTVETAEIIGASPGIAAVRRAVGQAAGTGFSVLIEGESGTGKELVARALHRLSPRRARRFCPVNCAALTDELVEAELFGSARGAFTGAVAARAGLFEEADAGTLFLDETAELSPRAQAKLLRALQEGEIRRLGENAYRRVDVRVVAATNRSLSDAAATGHFREDLLFRLAVVRIRVPPLRERVEDIPLLVGTFWAALARETRTRALMGPDGLAALCRHTWPGNVRELQNAIASLVLVAPPRGRLGERHVRQVLNQRTAPDRPVPLRTARRLFERHRLAEALARHGGRRAPAARELGLTRQGLSKAMRRLGLEGRPRRAGVA